MSKFLPKILISPDSIFCKPNIEFIIVVLPAPFSPISPTIHPLGIEKETSLTLNLEFL